ncbi:TolC family protein [Haliscomenobacter hydrossis]|uniref:Outer membrane efflux protein n=1 Tax=Haliscomenobacter hydrossis (strain ATCC 27775 / DSM 1100 / LMG 10767 / O) TaxID=760192 RepID=F4KU66_HALH1|nr:TolC family protein [Haliscomenobacter hydrossis]AEE50163.1 outer membrane efflux protein [Haliscomenobacter hydrossis DSM 1100]
MKNILLALSLLIIGAPIALAQTTLSLDECMRIALENNLQIKNSGYQLDLAEVSLRQTRAQQLPDLSFNFGQNFNFGRSVDINTNQRIDEVFISNGYGLNLSVPIFSGFGLKYQGQQLKQAIQAGIKDVETSRNLIRRNIITFYLNALANQELYRVAQEQANATRQQIELAQKRVSAGVANEIVVYELKAQLANEEFNAVSARNNAELAKVNLFQQMNQPVDLAVQLDANLIQTLGSPAEALSSPALVQKAEASLPEIQGAQLRILSAQKGVEAARSNFFPSINFQGNYGAFFTSTRTEAYFSQLDATRNGSMSIGLSLPLFRGGAIQQQVQRAVINESMAENDLADVKNQLRSEVEQAVQNHRATQEQWRAAEQQVAAQSENVRLFEKRFAAGTANTSEYILSKNNLAQANGNVISAKYRHLIWKMMLGYYENGKF